MIKALLGPTNTGKTFYAIERLAAHRDGIIGLPLRLLAREVYDKLLKIKGKDQVALITGEEKIIPKNAKYFSTTAESILQSRPFSFVALDEVQLAADPVRGHIFTQILCNLRGQHETLFLGAQSAKHTLKKLVPDIEFDSRERFSTLTYTGPVKINKLPRRSAIVAFSTDQVYALAEYLKRSKGGAAICMGSLSPQTRNAQLALYQNGETDYLVATDAIGMGVNMDVDHLAFASRSKFDGKRTRELRPSELGQIAGRAGRYLKDGTFGETVDCPLLDSHSVKQIEDHNYKPIERFKWRNADLDFSSIKTLQDSLNQPSSDIRLERSTPQLDELTLNHFQTLIEAKELNFQADQTKKIWEICQIPDFRKITIDQHFDLLQKIAMHLLNNNGTIPQNWLESEIRHLNDIEGSIDLISTKLAHIRTWRYMTFKKDWIENAQEWQAKTGEIEDNLSNSLHKKLTEKYVDHRNYLLINRNAQDRKSKIDMNALGEISLEGHYLGRVKGLRFEPDPRSAGSNEYRQLRNAAHANVVTRLGFEIEKFCACPHEEINMDDDCHLCWEGSSICVFRPSENIFRPKIHLKLDSFFFTPEMENHVQNRCASWLNQEIKTHLAPLLNLRNLANVSPLPANVKGFAYQLYENFGWLRRERVYELVNRMSQEERAHLRQIGVRFGEYFIYLPTLLKMKPARRLQTLIRLQNQSLGDKNSWTPTNGEASQRMSKKIDETDLQAYGYTQLGSRIVRIDIVERLAVLIREAMQYQTHFFATERMLSLVGCSREEMNMIFAALGFKKGPKIPGQTAKSNESSTVSNNNTSPTPQADAQHKTDNTGQNDQMPMQESWIRPKRKNKRDRNFKPHHNINAQRKSTNSNIKDGGRKDSKKKSNSQQSKVDIVSTSPFAVLHNLKIKNE